MPCARCVTEAASDAVHSTGWYGAVYFRKSNPPPEDWERDYRTAAEDGLNAFRHWFLWSAIEVAPGEYDWADYDCRRHPVEEVIQFLGCC